MIKIKYNVNKNSWTIKGLTDDNMEVLHALLFHVRLGDSTDGSLIATDLALAFEQYSSESPEFTITAECETCDSCKCEIESPTLNLY